MARAPIKVGDLVCVNDGLSYLAKVLEIDGNYLIVKPLMEGRKALAPRHVKKRWIDHHWRFAR